MPNGILLERGVKATDEATFRTLIDALKKPVADDIDGALQIFAPYLPTLALPQSVNYVETTVEQANVLFEPARVWGVPADAPVWAILARGKLKEVDERIPPPVPTVWVIVTKGVAGGIFVGTDDRVPFGGIDMTKLGTVVSISPSSVPKP
jgi:hypothetical protein